MVLRRKIFIRRGRVVPGVRVGASKPSVTRSLGEGNILLHLLNRILKKNNT